jgi:hypothetical protein
LVSVLCLRSGFAHHAGLVLFRIVLRELEQLTR